MSEVKSLNNLQITVVCNMSDVAKQWVNRKLQSIVIEEFSFNEANVVVNVRVRISASLLKGALYYKKVQGFLDSWELIAMDSFIKFPADTDGIKFGIDPESGKIIIVPLS